MTADETHAVLVAPPVAALLPVYVGAEDPVADLRAACRAGVAWLVDQAKDEPIRVVHDPLDPADAARGVAEPLAARVAAYLLDGHPATAEQGATLVLANGSARRTTKAPGFWDPRSEAFDAAVGAALRDGDAAALAGLDLDLGRALLTAGLGGLVDLGRRASHPGARVVEAHVDHSADPYGVQYWVARWLLAPA